MLADFVIQTQEHKEKFDGVNGENPIWGLRSSERTRTFFLKLLERIWQEMINFEMHAQCIEKNGDVCISILHEPGIVYNSNLV